MKNVNLKIKGIGRLKPVVCVDGKQLKFKKNNFGSYEKTISTDKDKMEIVIYRYLEINGRLWWLISILQFLVSIFGLLDTMKEKGCVIIDCKLIVDLNSSENCNIDLAIDENSENGKAVNVATELAVEEIVNRSYVDEKAKKRLKIMKFVKLFVFIAIVIGLIFLIRALV